MVAFLAKLRDLLLQRNRPDTTMKFVSLLHSPAYTCTLSGNCPKPSNRSFALLLHLLCSWLNIYSSLFFNSILARHVAGARRNGPTRFGVWFAAPSRYTPPVSHRTPYHRRSQRRRHKPPPFCKVLFPFHWVCCLPVPQFLC